MAQNKHKLSAWPEHRIWQAKDMIKAAVNRQHIPGGGVIAGTVLSCTLPYTVAGIVGIKESRLSFINVAYSETKLCVKWGVMVIILESKHVNSWSSAGIWRHWKHPEHRARVCRAHICALFLCCSASPAKPLFHFKVSGDRCALKTLFIWINNCPS